MEAESNRSGTHHIVDALVNLYGYSFGGKRNGRYRISRSFLRQISGRRKLSSEFIRELADDMFERGYVLIDLETHYAVLSQDVFDNYRRITNKAFSKLEASVDSTTTVEEPGQPNERV